MNKSSSGVEGNPYIVGNPATGTVFKGREDVFTFVCNTLVFSHQNAVVLHGQRRMGKTSILKELPNRLPPGKFHAVYFDLQGWATKTLSEVLYGLAEAIAKSLGLQPVAVTKFKADRYFFHQGFLPQIWKQLGDLNLLLLLDEFDVLDRPEKLGVSGNQTDSSDDTARQELYPYLRKLLDDEKRLAFVFVVGRRLEELPHWILRVFKDAQHKKIGLLNEEDARALIEEPVREILTYDPKAIQAILALTSGHAYFTQLICYELFNHACQSKQDKITPADVQAVIDPALQTGGAALAWLWDGLTPEGQLLISAIANVTSEGEVATEDQILAALQRFRLRPPGSEWSKTARTLTEWDVLDRDADGRYRFVTELVRLWVLQAHPLAAEKARIGDLSPKAALSFKAARESHGRHRLDEAIEKYRMALSDNPNHLGAWLGLGQALRERGDLTAAIEALEEAFWLDEAQGRTSLVTARLAQGEDLEHRGKFVEAAVHFRRALELEPENRRLQEKLRVWYDQGVKAMDARYWRRTTAFLERVVDINPNYRDAAHRLKEARWEEERSIPVRLVKMVMGGLLAVILVGAGIASALTPGGLGALLGKIDPTSLLGAATSPSTTPTPTAGVTQVTLEATPMPTIEVTATAVEVTLTPSPSPSPVPTGTFTPSATPIPTATPTLTISPTPVDIPTPTVTPTPIVIVVTPTSTPTSPLPSYPAPELVAPDDKAVFTGRPSVPRLRWNSVGTLGSSDFYVITLEFQENGKTVFDGARGEETGWDVDPRLFDRVDASNPVFKWRVVVSHITTDAEGKEVGTDVSPVSETRTFKWTGK